MSNISYSYDQVPVTVETGCWGGEVTGYRGVPGKRGYRVLGGTGIRLPSLPGAGYRWLPDHPSYLVPSYPVPGVPFYLVPGIAV